MMELCLTYRAVDRLVLQNWPAFPSEWPVVLP